MLSVYDIVLETWFFEISNCLKAYRTFLLFPFTGDSGSFGALTGQSSCALCAPGTYSAKAFAGALGATVCSQCSVGFVTAISGRSQCDPCLPGNNLFIGICRCIHFYSFLLAPSIFCYDSGQYQSMTGQKTCVV